MENVRFGALNMAGKCPSVLSEKSGFVTTNYKCHNVLLQKKPVLLVEMSQRFVKNIRFRRHKHD